MPLLDDLSLPITEEEMVRRKFLGLVGVGALGLSALGTVITTLRFLEPRVLFEEDLRFGVGRPEEFPVGTVLVLPKQKVYVVRTAAGFYAVSSTCTHLGCMTRYVKAKSEFACPCHGSRFHLDGTVEAGPAPKPLPRFALSVERGVLVVDAGKRVPADLLLQVA